MATTRIPFATALVCGSFSLALLAACSDKGAASPKEIRALIDKGELNVAVVHLKNAMSAAPESPELRLLLGRALLTQSQPVLAEVELRRASKEPTLRDEALPLLAEAMVGGAKGKAFLDEFGEARLDKPEADTSLAAWKVRALIDLARLDEANGLLQPLLNADPSNPRLSLLDARRQAMAGQPAEAIATVARLLERHPAHVEALLFQADLKSAVEDDDEGALQSYKRVVELNPKSLPGHSAIISILLRRQDLDGAQRTLSDMKRVNPAHVQTRFMEAQVALARADLPKARDIAQQLQAEAPESVSAMQLLGLVELREGRLIRAEGLLTKAMHKDEFSASIRQLLAEIYNKKGQPDQASEVLRPLLEKGAGDPHLFRQAADAAMLAGDVASARKLYAQALEKRPEDLKARRALAVVEVARGRVDAGLQALRDLSQAQPADLQTDLVLIDTLLQRHDLAGALKAADAMAAKDPKAPGVDLIRGRIQLMQADWAGARASLERAVSLHPLNYPSVGALALLDLSQGRAADAIRRHEAFLAAKPEPAGRSLGLRGLAGLKHQINAPHDEVVALLRDAVAADPDSEAAATMLVDGLLRGRQVEPALNAAQAALAKMPDSASLLDALGRAQMASGDLRQAGASFGRLVLLRPRSAVAQLRVAQVAHLLGDARGSLSGYLKALTLDPELDEAQSNLATLAASDGQLPAVLAAVRKLQRDEAQLAYPHRIEGDVFLSRREFPQAVVAYRAGLGKARPGRLPVRLHRALVSAGQADEARKMADAWLKGYPEDVAFRAHLADHAMTMRDYKSAEAHYRAVLDLAPTQFMALNNLAWILTQDKRPGAVDFAKRALQAKPGSAPVMDTLAHALVAEGQREEAVRLAEEVLAMVPDSPDYQFSMAEVLGAAGERKRALALLDGLDSAKVGPTLKTKADQLRKRLLAAA